MKEEIPDGNKESLIFLWKCNRGIYILHYMKQLLIEVDDALAAELEKVAPARSRRRSEFIRCAMRQALWDLEEQKMAEAYKQLPDSEVDAYLDPHVWEAQPKMRAVRRKK
jgi:predicted transcriptional regulator